jgi:hypothetical protein
MLSLFMVLILILGINYVFRSATEAVGAGQTTNQINADAQSSQPIVFEDLRNVSKNPPAFIISSQLITQFLNTQDASNGADPTTIVVDNAGTKALIANTPGNVSPALPSNRVHRTDMVKFFAHALYQRRSGPDGTFYATDTSNDAFIELGHAALPANDLSGFYGPSSIPNTGATVTFSNGVTYIGVPRVGAYAADWVLARRVTLLKDATLSNSIPAGDYFYGIVAAGGTTKDKLGNSYGWNMSPFAYGTPDTNGGVTQFQSSRYDLAGVTPEQFDRIIGDALATWRNSGCSGNSLWWNPLVYALTLNQPTATPPQYYQMSSSASNPNGAAPPYVVPYINAAPGFVGILAAFGVPVLFPTDPGQVYNRPQCNPAIQNPVTSASIAEMAPYFLQHCSQFIVEYAGDYMQQDPVSGNIMGLGPDGQIDYYLDANSNKHIRWYGMPRSSTGQLHDDGLGNQVLIRGYDAATDGPTAVVKSYTGPGPMSVMLNYFTDVIPLRDYYNYWLNANPPDPTVPPGAYSPPWEVDVNFDSTHDYGAYYTAPVGTGPNANAFNNPVNPPRYVAAWHDDMPAMVRILIKVDDPNNKVKDGPWYEYVFRLK